MFKKFILGFCVFIFALGAGCANNPADEDAMEASAPAFETPSALPEKEMVESAGEDAETQGEEQQRWVEDRSSDGCKYTFSADVSYPEPEEAGYSVCEITPVPFTDELVQHMLDTLRPESRLYKRPEMSGEEEDAIRYESEVAYKKEYEDGFSFRGESHVQYYIEDGDNNDGNDGLISVSRYSGEDSRWSSFLYQRRNVNFKSEDGKYTPNLLEEAQAEIGGKSESQASYYNENTAMIAGEDEFGYEIIKAMEFMPGEALHMANSLLEDLGIENMRAEAVRRGYFYNTNHIHPDNEIFEEDKRPGYTVMYNLYYDGLEVITWQPTGNWPSSMRLKEKLENGEVYSPPYEAGVTSSVDPWTVMVYISEGGIEKVSWHSPVIAAGKTEENVALLPFLDVTDAVSDMVYDYTIGWQNEYAFKDRNSIHYEVLEVRLTATLINNGDDLFSTSMVPCWNVSLQREDDDIEGFFTHYVLVNAVDGKIIAPAGIRETLASVQEYGVLIE